MERWDMAPKDALEGRSWLRVPLSASSPCGRFDGLDSSPDVAPLLQGTVVSGEHVLRSLGWHEASERGDDDCLGSKVSKDGGGLVYGQPGQEQA